MIYNCIQYCSFNLKQKKKEGIDCLFYLLSAPRIKPQKLSDKNTTKVERPWLFPIVLGSGTLPMVGK
jgi:hypothetical protein